MMRLELARGNSGQAFRGKRNGIVLRVVQISVIGLSGASLVGCVTLKAPDKPIEINLNINIKQEVVYRLDGQAKNLIQQQADIF